LARTHLGQRPASGLNVANNATSTPTTQTGEAADSVDLKSLVAEEAVTVGMHVQEVVKKAEEAKEEFQALSMVKPMPHFTNRFLVLETSKQVQQEIC